MADQSQGNVAPEATQGGDAPKYVTEEQLNKAITARFADFSKKQDSRFSESFGAFEKKILEALPKPPEPGTQQTQQPDDKSIENHPLFKGMAKKLADLEDRARKAEELTAAERSRAKDLTLKQSVMEALASANVKDAVRAKHAASFLIREGLAKWNDAGDALVFRDADGDVDFATGFKGWLKSDDAKLYLPSPDAAVARSGSTQQRIPPGAANAVPANIDDLDFEAKLAIARAQIEKQGVDLP